DKEPASQVAADFHFRELNLRVQPQIESQLAALGRHTREHVFLVGISLAAAVVLAVPFGILASRWPMAGQGMLAATGILQTIPSIALLVFMIPLLGIGTKPAIAALFLYSFLTIAQHTYTSPHATPTQNALSTAS